MKKALIILLALTMAFSAVACTAPAEDTATSETPATSTEATETPSGEKVVVEIWTGDRHDLEYTTAKIEEFNAASETIQIEQTVVTDDYFNMLSLAVTSGTAPDLATVNGGATGFDMQLWADNGLVLPLNDYITAAGEEFERNTDISKHMFNGTNVINDNIYWVPTVVRSGTRMIYNVDLMEEAGYTEFPTTVEEMVALSVAITENGAGEYYGYAATSSAPFVRSFEGIAELGGQNTYGYDYVNGRYDFSGFIPFIEAYQPMVADNSLLPGSTTQGVDAMRAQFAIGAAGIWANASQEAGVFTDQFPIEDFEWGVAELPTLDGEVKGAQTAQPQKGYMMMSGTDVPDEAFEVIEYFASEEYLKGYVESGYALPYSEHITSIADMTQGGRIADFELQDYESFYPAPPSVTLEGDNAQTVIWSAIMGERDIQEAIDDLNTRYNTALDNDVAAGKIKRLVIADYDPMNPSAGTMEYLDQ